MPTQDEPNLGPQKTTTEPRDSCVKDTKPDELSQPVEEVELMTTIGAIINDSQETLKVDSYAQEMEEAVRNLTHIYLEKTATVISVQKLQKEEVVIELNGFIYTDATPSPIGEGANLLANIHPSTVQDLIHQEEEEPILSTSMGGQGEQHTTSLNTKSPPATEEGGRVSTGSMCTKSSGHMISDDDTDEEFDFIMSNAELKIPKRKL